MAVIKRGVSKASGLRSRLVGAAIYLAIGVVATPAEGQSVRVMVGEMGQTGESPQVPHALSEAVRESLRTRRDVRLVASAASADFVVRGSVVELEHQPGRPGRWTRCRVSFVVADARSGAIRLMLGGNGTVGRGWADLPRLLTAAVQSALRPLSTVTRELR